MNNRTIIMTAMVAVVMAVGVAMIVSAETSTNTVGGVTATVANNASVAGSTGVWTNFTINDTTNTTSWYNITFPSGFDVSGAVVTMRINGTVDPTDWTDVNDTLYINVSSDDPTNVSANANTIQYINISNVTVPSTAAAYVVNVATNNSITVPLDFTVTPGPVTQLNVTLNETDVKAGQCYNVTVKAWDVHSNTNTSYTETVNLTTNTSSALYECGTTLTEVAEHALVGGTWNFTVFSKKAEVINITSTVATDASIDGTSTGLDVTNATADKLAVLVPPTITKGATGDTVNISVRDQYDNEVITSSGIDAANISLTATGSATFTSLTEVTPGIHYSATATDTVNEAVTITARDRRGTLETGTNTTEFLNPVAGVTVTTNKTDIVGDESDSALIVMQLVDAGGNNVNLTAAAGWTRNNTLIDWVSQDSYTSSTGAATAVVKSAGIVDIGCVAITADSESKEETVLINVTRGPPENANSTAIRSDATIHAGQNVTINVTIRDAQNRALPVESVTFTSNTTGSAFPDGSRDYTKTTDSNGNISINYTTTRDFVGIDTRVNNITITTAAPGNVSQKLFVTSYGPNNTTTTVVNSTTDGNATVNTEVTFNWTIKDRDNNLLGGESVVVTTDDTSGAEVVSYDSTSNSTTGNVTVVLKLSQTAGVNDVTLNSIVGNVSQTEVITGTPAVIDHINITPVITTSGVWMPNLVKSGSYNLTLQTQLKDQYENNNLTSGVNISYNASFWDTNGVKHTLGSVGSGLYQNDTTTLCSYNLTDSNGMAVIMVTPPNETGWVNGTAVNTTHGLTTNFNISVRQASDITLTYLGTKTNVEANISSIEAGIDFIAQLVDDSGQDVSQQTVGLYYSVIETTMSSAALNPFSGITSADGANTTEFTATSVVEGQTATILVVTEEADTGSVFRATICLTAVANDVLPATDYTRLNMAASPTSIVAGDSSYNSTILTVTLWDATKSVVYEHAGIPITITTTDGTLCPLDPGIGTLNESGTSYQADTDANGTVTVTLTSTSTPTTARIFAIDNSSKPDAEISIPFEGPATTLNMSVSPTSVVADNSATATITVWSKDANGNSVTHPGSITVNLSTTGSATLSTATLTLNETNDGVTTATIKNNVNETVTIGATSTGLTAAPDKTVVFTEPVVSNNIHLKTGWNLISFPVMLTNASAENVTAGIASNVEKMWEYDAETESWSWFVPGVGASTLTQLTPRMYYGKNFGYWLKMTSPATLTYSGSFLGDDPLELPPTYSVVTGWNLIGYHSKTDVSANTYLENIGTSGWSRMYKYSPTDGYTAIPGGDTMDRNCGYWLYATQNGTIVV